MEGGRIKVGKEGGRGRDEGKKESEEEGRYAWSFALDAINTLCPMSTWLKEKNSEIVELYGAGKLDSQVNTT